MKQSIRYAIVFLALAGILFLARNPTAGAADPQTAALQGELASVRGYIWDDADRDGMQDAGEAGVRNVTVRLYNAGRSLVATARTDRDGRYELTNIPPGEYYVDIVAPTGYVLSIRDQGDDEAVDSDSDPATGETSPTTLVAGENLLMWDAGLYRTVFLPSDAPGTVRPPPPDLTICQDGMGSVGGLSTLEVNNLRAGYCLAATLRNGGLAVGRIPDGAGSLLANITMLRVFFQGNFVYDVPNGDGQVEICYAVPANRTVQIYFYDFYGPQFGTQTGQPSWEPLPTTVEGGTACAPAQTSGAYALIGQ